MTDELLTLLDRVDPVDREQLRSLPTPEEELVAIVAGPRVVQPSAPRSGRSVLRYAVPVAGAAALIVAAVALLPGEDGGASPEAAQALQSAATVAAAQTESAGASEYNYSRVREVYITSTGDGGTSYAYYMPTTIESWIAPDGSGRVRQTRHEIEWPGPRDKRRWREAGSVAGPLRPERTTDRRYGPGELNGPPYEGELPAVRDLPADPDELAQVFEDERNDSSSSVPLNAKMFEYGTSVLLQAASAPELRSAAYEVLAGVEGVELRGDAKDPLGRPGVEVAITTEYSGNIPERYSLIYDEATAHPLAYTERLTEPADFIDSLLTTYIVLEDSGVVPSVKQRP